MKFKKLFYKECEVCGYKIFRLYPKFVFYDENIQCKKCKAEYKTNFIFLALFECFSWSSGIYLLIAIFIWGLLGYLEKNYTIFFSNTEELLVVFIIYVLGNIFVALFKPLYKIEYPRKRKHLFRYFLCFTACLFFVAVLWGFLG